MKAILLCSVLALGGCSTLFSAVGLDLPARDQALVTCEAWSQVQDAILVVGPSLSDSNKSRLKQIDAQVSPICEADDIQAAATTQIGSLVAEAIQLSGAK